MGVVRALEDKTVEVAFEDMWKARALENMATAPAPEDTRGRALGDTPPEAALEDRTNRSDPEGMPMVRERVPKVAAAPRASSARAGAAGPKQVKSAPRWRAKPPWRVWFVFASSAPGLAAEPTDEVGNDFAHQLEPLFGVFIFGARGSLRLQ
jgi:hypothetical protein